MVCFEYECEKNRNLSEVCYGCVMQYIYCRVIVTATIYNEMSNMRHIYDKRPRQICYISFYMQWINSQRMEMNAFVCHVHSNDS